MHPRDSTSACYTPSSLYGIKKRGDSPSVFSADHWSRTKSSEQRGWETVPKSRALTSPRLPPSLSGKGVYVSWKDASTYFVGQDVLQVVDSRGYFVGKFLYASGNTAHYFADGHRESDLIATLDGPRSKWKLAMAGGPETYPKTDKTYLTSAAFAQKCEWLTSLGCGPLDPSKKQTLLCVIVVWVRWACVDAPVCVPALWFSREGHSLPQVEDYRDKLQENGIPCTICTE